MENKKRKKLKMKRKSGSIHLDKKRIALFVGVFAILIAVLAVGVFGKIRESKEAKRIQEAVAAETRAREAATHLAEETEAETETETETEAETESETESEEQTVAARIRVEEFLKDVEEFVVPEFDGSLDVTRRASSEVVPYDGVIRSISCWGDSLTEGTGRSSNIVLGGLAGPTMPSTLAALTNRSVFNFGIYGELSRDIASRQGGLKMYVNNVTIPATGSVLIDGILCEDGNWLYIGFHDCYAWSAGFDSCTIAGVTGKLSLLSNGSYRFTRSTPGSPVVITENTQLITPPAVARRNDIQILEMGNNGGWSSFEELIAQYDSMLANSSNRYYIIIGDTDFDSQYEGDYDWERVLQEAYGAHFLNMRAYLSDIARFAEVGLNPTEDDLYRISIGEVPYSFKIGDYTHLNSYGYWLEGVAVYNKGVELGYWPGGADTSISGHLVAPVEPTTETPTETAPVETQTQKPTETPVTTKPATEKTTEATSTASEQTTASHATSGAQ